MSDQKYTVTADVGGTFTDFVLLTPTGEMKVFKEPSTPKDPALAIFNGLERIARSENLNLKEFTEQIGIIIHGTTVATNTLLTKSGAKVGLLTTEGMRDELEQRLKDKFGEGKGELFDHHWRPAPVLVRRKLRRPVKERIGLGGVVITPIDEQSVIEQIGYLKQEGVEGIAICFMHSYANPSHEQVAKRLVEEHYPEPYLTVSSELAPQIRLFNRTSTSVLNSYVGPIVGAYMRSLINKLEEAGFSGALLVMQINGGMLTPEVMAKMPVKSLTSGPAAGPTAGMIYAGVHGYTDVICMDMGGTSFDTVMVRGGEVFTMREGDIAGYRVGLPMIAVRTIGAGGGSIGWIDAAGLLQLGPDSAGAEPGPAAYGKGGTRPTCTDADLVLGYINKDFFAGGEIPLYPDKAGEAIRRDIAEPLGLSLTDAAAGMHHVINVNMSLAIREITIEQGLDPREFVLVVGGGAGAVHVGGIAAELSIPLIIIPREAPQFCAMGMMYAEVKHDYVTSYTEFFRSVDRDKFTSIFQEMRNEGEKLLRSEGIPDDRMEILYTCDVRYDGQHHEVEVEITQEEIDVFNLEPMRERFHEKHMDIYAFNLKEVGTECELVSLRLTAVGRMVKPGMVKEDYQGEDSAKAEKGTRRVYLPDKKAFGDVIVYDAMKLGYGNKVIGPAIIEHPTTNIVVLAEYNVVYDEVGAAIMYLKSEEERVKREGIIK